jgi:signal transduction histidine kinase
MTPLTVKTTEEPKFAAARGSDLRNISLLVVDDDPQALPLVEMALMDAHFERQIEVASTVTAGLERIKADEHDIYLIDHRLPDGTGINLIHEAKKAGITKPFILMTGYGSGALDEAAFHEGAADYVEKHMLSAHLERAIRYAVRDWNASRTLRDREDQLRHAQKMEGIGRLAGGVAHDFNNLLGVILGYTELASRRLALQDPAQPKLEQVRKAAERAAALTGQLLAFSRKQVLVPEVLDLADVVADLSAMLHRVIGEDIELVTVIPDGLGVVRADRGQLGQAILNLAVNARDAMPSGGKLTIEAANVDLTDDEASRQPGLRPGPHVRLAVTDTGSGMSSDVLPQIFEPFFTTKGPGKGTGLGLSMVYGFLQQSGGHVTVESDVGRGTAFSLYLPRLAEDVRAASAPTATAASSGGSEIVLLVEDAGSLREMIREILTESGYRILEADTAERALEIAGAHEGPIDLLLTDVVMPGIGGAELAHRLHPRRPATRVLFMSGYTDDVMVQRGVLAADAALIQKPFSSTALLGKIREALDRDR